MSSNRSQGGQPNLKARNPALVVVLNSLAAPTLRDVIKSAAESNPVVEAALEKALFIPTDSIPDTAARKRKATEMSAAEESSAKRTTQRYRVCQNCEGTFDVTTNGPTACTYHPERSEPDYDGDFWADHDEDCHGIIEDLRGDFPEGFLHPCCGNNMTNKGCKTEEHKEKPGTSAPGAGAGRS